jgi:hypothetical protein
MKKLLWISDPHLLIASSAASKRSIPAKWLSSPEITITIPLKSAVDEGVALIKALCDRWFECFY